MKKCPSELQLEAFIRESAGGAGGAESKPGTGPSEPGGSAVFSPGGVGFGDSNTMDGSSWWYGSIRPANPVVSQTASVSGEGHTYMLQLCNLLMKVGSFSNNHVKLSAMCIS